MVNVTVVIKKFQMPTAKRISQKTRLEGTSRIIWSSLSWQKHGLDKVAQHPVQLNL